MLLPVIGAGLGGLEAYRRTGGDIGATALGALGGAAIPGGLRMAGTALGGLGAGALSKTALGQVLQSQAAKTGGSLLTQIPAAAGGLAAGIGTFLGAPALAGKIASAAAPAAQKAVSAGAGLAGYPQGYGSAAQYDGSALPTGLNQSGPVNPYGTSLDIIDPSGVAAGRRLEYAKNIEQQRDAMRMLLPEIFNASEARSKNELTRQLAAAGVRQNILTSANMLERAQQAAQQMGANAASQAGAALTSQYQYQ